MATFINNEIKMAPTNLNLKLLRSLHPSKMEGAGNQLSD